MLEFLGFRALISCGFGWLSIDGVSCSLGVNPVAVFSRPSSF